jgi:hypothetical protein
MTKRSVCLCLLAAIVTAPTVSAGNAADGPSPTTLAAWTTYIARTEARIERELLSAGAEFLVSDFEAAQMSTREAVRKGAMPVAKLTTFDGRGKALPTPGGMIAHWRGAVLLRGVTLDTLLHELQRPDNQGPLPEDVLSLRVLERKSNELRVAMRLTRTKIVTATYDTEHLTTYRRLSGSRAASKSISTKIVEVANAGTSTERPLPPGQDRGFLWRMNSYWRYQEVPGGVIVELESLTLSRSIPLGLGVVVEPLIDRIARESMQCTLAGIRQLYSVPSRSSKYEPKG